jgi:hypothetical protein
MDSPVLVIVLRLLGIGWYISICLVIGTFGGMWIDEILNSGPVCTLLGLFFGLTLAFIGTKRLLIAVISTTEKNKNGPDS